MSRLVDLRDRARRIYRTEGPMSLAPRGLRFLAYCLWEHRSYWLYIEAIADLNEADFLPQIDDFVFKFVTSNREADELEALGLEFRSHVPNGRERLDRGAVALCTFVGWEIASLCWIAMTEEAKRALPEPPFTIYFDNNEACGSDAWTNPKYRRMGLAVHRTMKTHQFLWDNNIAVSRTAYRKGTVYPERLAARFNRTKYAEGRYLRILWWKSWKERPLAT